MSLRSLIIKWSDNCASAAPPYANFILYFNSQTKKEQTIICWLIYISILAHKRGLSSNLALNRLFRHEKLNIKILFIKAASKIFSLWQIKKPTLYGFCTKPTKSVLKSVENSILGFGLFSELFRTFIPGCLCISSQNAFWRVRIVFLRFGIYGNT